MFLVVFYYYDDYCRSSVVDAAVVDLDVVANDECDDDVVVAALLVTMWCSVFRFLSILEVDSSFYILGFPWKCLGSVVVGFDGMFLTSLPLPKKSILNATLRKHHRRRCRCHHHHYCSFHPYLS